MVVFLPVSTFKLKFCICKVTVFISITSFGRASCSLKPVIILSSSRDKKSRQTCAVGCGADEDQRAENQSSVEVVLHNHYGTSEKHAASSKNGFLEFGTRASVFAAVEAG